MSIDLHKDQARARLAAAVTWAERVQRERPTDHRQIAVAWAHVRSLKRQLRVLGIITLMTLTLTGCVTTNHNTTVEDTCRRGFQPHGPGGTDVRWNSCNGD